MEVPRVSVGRFNSTKYPASCFSVCTWLQTYGCVSSGAHCYITHASMVFIASVQHNMQACYKASIFRLLKKYIVGCLQSLDIIWVRYFRAFAFNRRLPCTLSLSLCNGAHMTITVQTINTQRTGSSSCQTATPPSNVFPVHLNAPNTYMKRAQSTKTNRCGLTQQSERPLFPWWCLRWLGGLYLMWACSLICEDRVLKDSNNILQKYTVFTFC